MKNTFRKALVAVAALIAVSIVPISAATHPQSVGQGNWPDRIAKHV